MTWLPVAMRWPEQATQWMTGLDAAKDLASTELNSSSTRLTALDGLASTNPSPVGGPAAAASSAGRNALQQQLSDTPAYVAVTPFQPDVGHGTGQQRYLSAPNLLQALAGKIGSVAGSNQTALVILFVSTRFDHFAAALGRFNALLPIPELQKAERRAGHLARLETEKWALPIASPGAKFAPLPLHKCTVTRAAQQAMSAQLATLEAYGADSAPFADLATLAGKKAAQQTQKAQQLDQLKQSLAGGTADASMRAKFLGHGNANALKAELLSSNDLGHEWVLSAGLVLVGTQSSLSFVRELIGL